jgi:hypothetical protein
MKCEFPESLLIDDLLEPLAKSRNLRHGKDRLPSGPDNSVEVEKQNAVDYASDPAGHHESKG